MKQTIIRLTENDLHNIIRATVTEMISERHVLKVPHKETPMDMPPMGDGMDMPPMSNDPSMGGAAPQGEDIPPMDTDPSMGGAAPQGGDDEITSLFNSLSDENKKAAKKYIESMVDDDNNNGIDDGSENDPMGGSPNDMLPMQESQIHEFNNISMVDRQGKRQEKKLTKDKVNLKNPYISDRK